MSNDVSYTLDFDEPYQAAVFGYMMEDREFLLRCKSVIPYKLFTNPYTSALVHILYDHFDKFHELPTSMQEFETLVSYRFHGDYAVQKKHKEALAYCAVAKTQFSFKTLQGMMTGWIKLVKMKEMIYKAGELYNNRRFDEGLSFSKLMIAKIEEASFIREEAVQYSNLPEFYLNLGKVSNADCCTIGHPDFDELLREGSKLKNPANPGDIRQITRGSLAPGNSTVLMGSSNAGKTTSVQTIIANNIMFGKFVLEVTLEQNDSELKDKLVRCLSGLPGTLLSSMDVSPEIAADVKRRLTAVEQLCSLYLTHHHWIKADDMYVESIINLIMIEQEKMIGKEIRDAKGNILKPKGRGYDLLVVDYPGKLSVRNIGGRNWKTHEEKGYVYDQFINITKQYKFHGLFPAQTNRDGYKVNRGDADRMVDQGDAGFSFYIMQIADNVITLNRSPKDIARKIIKMYLAKSRTQATGTTFISQTNMAISRTHGFDLVSAHVDDAGGAEEAITSLLFTDSKPKQDLSQLPSNPLPDASQCAPIAPVGPKEGVPLPSPVPEEPEGLEALPPTDDDNSVYEEIVSENKAEALAVAEQAAAIEAKLGVEPVVPTSQPDFMGTAKPGAMSDEAAKFLTEDDSVDGRDR